jgi:glycosyltransferase involved in cell wall biosynthesis
MKPLRLVIVTPLMPPAPGGGGVYTDTIGQALINQYGAELVCVVTEKHPAARSDERHLNGRYLIQRRFPFRAGSATKNWKSYLAYAKQNLQYRQLGKICAEHDATAMLVHSSLHNNPNLLTGWIRSLRGSGLRVVSDVRDPLLPPRRFRQLYPYNKVLACSQSVANHLAPDINLRRQLETVPIPLDVEKPADEMVERILARYSLHAGRYLLSTNGLLHRKGLSALLALAKELCRRNSGITIAIAGKARDQTNEVKALIENGILRYLGVLPHDDVLSLSSAALANINLSPVEGMPRTTIETLAVGGAVIVTKGIPEFDAVESDAVVDPLQPVKIADLVERMKSTSIAFPYDISKHSVAATVAKLHHALQGNSF